MEPGLRTYILKRVGFAVRRGVAAHQNPDVVALARSRGLEDAYASVPEAYTCNANNKKN